MSLLPIRHPNDDFFVLDIADAVPKDDTSSMEHPLFSLATKPDMRHLQYQNGENTLEIRPSYIGLPTIFDKDVLIFCISQLMRNKNIGNKIGKTVRFSARELLIATNRPTNNLGYKRLDAAFARLQGTQFKTNISTGGKRETRYFGLVDEAGYVMKEDFSRMDYCEVVLSDWFMRAIESDEVVTISSDYFRLRRPLERRLYEIVRKHCGNQIKWQISLSNLQNKTGSNAPLKKFRMNIREIIAADVTPFYHFELNENDLFIARPRSPSNVLSPEIKLPEWAEEKARAEAIKLGWDYYALREKWLTFAQAETAKGNPPKNAGAAFISWAKTQEKLR